MNTFNQYDIIYQMPLISAIYEHTYYTYILYIYIYIYIYSYIIMINNYMIILIAPCSPAPSRGARPRGLGPGLGRHYGQSPY